MKKHFIGALVALSLSCPVLAEDGTLDQAANGYILLCAVLVLLMSIPAIGLFYGGLVRAKNALSVLEQCLAVCSIAILFWLVAGYSIAFSSGDHLFASFSGNLDKAFLLSVNSDSLSGALSEYTFFIFQAAFCAIASCLIVGALVERVRFSALLIGILLWMLLSYAPLAHMVWGGGFIDSTFAAYDFAGGDVVHINAAVAGIVGAYMLGKRSDLGKINLAPHNLTLTYIGGGMLWLGWFGFNAGSELTADAISALAFINTAIAPAAAALSWMCVEWIMYKKPSTLGTVSGVLAGLVAITPACAFVGPIGALIIGIAAGVCCVWGVHGFKRLTGIDDSLDVFGIHGIGAIIGALLTGVFCAPSLGGAGFKGEWTSIGGQVYGQFMSIVITVIWSGIASFIAFKVAGLLTGGIRVSDETEREGLDIAVHGERGYNL